jgi:hypothetical protein
MACTHTPHCLLRFQNRRPLASISIPSGFGCDSRTNCAQLAAPLLPSSHLHCRLQSSERTRTKNGTTGQCPAPCPCPCPCPCTAYVLRTTDTPTAAPPAAGLQLRYAACRHISGSPTGIPTPGLRSPATAQPCGMRGPRVACGGGGARMVRTQAAISLKTKNKA